jgi:hypothetical protein
VGLRETLNENPRLATGLTVGLILVAVILLGWQLMPGGEKRPPRPKVFFTDDDGKTYFPDDQWKIPPFQRNGKEAVRAHVYRCGDKTPFVAWMEKYDDASKAKLQKFFDDPKNHNISPDAFDDAVRMIKRPGAAQKWLKWTYTLLEQARGFKCPGGEMADEIGPTEK